MGGSPVKIEENVERILQYSETKESLLQGGRGRGGNKRKKRSVRKMLARKELGEQTMLDGGTRGLRGVFVFLSITLLVFKKDNWKGTEHSVSRIFSSVKLTHKGICVQLALCSMVPDAWLFRGFKYKKRKASFIGGEISCRESFVAASFGLG